MITEENRLTENDRETLAHMLWYKAAIASGDEWRCVHRIERGYTMKCTAIELQLNSANLIDWEVATIKYNNLGGLTIDIDGITGGRPIIEALKDPKF